jgi:hypothetical protein
MGQAAGVRLGIVRGISYGVFGPPTPFMEQARALGTRVARIYFTWNQIEPQPGRYDWSAVDALLDQLEPADDLWVTVVSASRWATRQPTDFLPASMPRDNAAYQMFVGALVSHCRGMVRYWQCNNEPSNPGLWSGSAEDYAALAGSFAQTVRKADPDAEIILGGCGFDVLSATRDTPARSFFDDVLTKAPNSFDLFDIHLYDDPRRIPFHIGNAREMLRTHGLDRPVVVGECGGPTVLGFPELGPAMEQVMGQAFAGGEPSLDTADLTQLIDTPDRLAMRALYDRMAELPPELQMFMQGCSPALEARRHRIACREVVTRALLAMSCGVDLVLWWNLAPEVPNYRDRFNLMGFVSNKLALMDFVHGELTRREPAADAVERLTGYLDGAKSVRRLESEAGLVVIGIERDIGPVLVMWIEADAFTGEDEPPRLITWPWPGATAHVVDVFGSSRDVATVDRQLSLGVGVTPLFIS